MLLEQLKTIVGEGGWRDDPADLEPHLTEWRDRLRGTTPLMVSPASTEEVAAVISACRDAGTAPAYPVRYPAPVSR